MTTKAVPGDTAGKLSEVIFRPGGATEISRWWSLSATTGTGLRRLFASRQGRRTGIRNRINPGPAPFQGALCCRGISGGYASLRHRLISLAPPALKEFASSIKVTSEPRISSGRPMLSHGKRGKTKGGRTARKICSAINKKKTASENRTASGLAHWRY